MSIGKFKVKDKAECTVDMKCDSGDGLKLKGTWNFKCFDKDGNLKWEEDNHNLVVNEGLDHILATQFTGSAQVDPWYVGLKGAGAPAAGDTLASHGSWAEFSDYTGNRQAFVEGAVASQSVSNTASPAAFPITGSGTVAGAFLASVATGSAGTLFAAVDFASSRTVSNGDTINATYTLSGNDDGV